MDLISKQLKISVEEAVKFIENKKKITQDNAVFLTVVPTAIHDVENGFPPLHLREKEKKRLKIFLQKYLVIFPQDEKAIEFKRQLEI